MKKLLFMAAMALLLASCSEDYKDWAEPQSNTTTAITFGNGSATSVGVIDLNLIPDTATVKVCNLTVPTASDTAYKTYCYIDLDGKEYSVDENGMMSVYYLQEYVVNIFGPASVERELTAKVHYLMSNGETSKSLYSDEFTITVIPKAAETPDLWYLVGGCIGDGTWNNSEGAVGTGLIPMYADPDNYALLTYVGYFPAGQGFKLIHQPGSWDEQWGAVNGEFVKNDGSSSNIEVSADGYYKITYDLTDDEVNIESYTDPVGVYSAIYMPGAYQGWDPAGNEMAAMSKVVENHDWILTATYDEDTELKFAANGSWDANWGNTTFPVGIGTQGGPNIPVTAGTYTVVFNDILGKYYFIAQY